MPKRKDNMKNELQEKIAAFQQEALPNIPPAISDQLQKHIAELVQAGAAQHSLTVGDPAPDFSLPSVHGASVTLSAALQNGPVVVTFYRGGW